VALVTLIGAELYGKTTAKLLSLKNYLQGSVDSMACLFL